MASRTKNYAIDMLSMVAKVKVNLATALYLEFWVCAHLRSPQTSQYSTHMKELVFGDATRMPSELSQLFEDNSNKPFKFYQKALIYLVHYFRLSDVMIQLYIASGRRMMSQIVGCAVHYYKPAPSYHAFHMKRMKYRYWNRTRCPVQTHAG
jgi:hypothetical protein